MNQVLLDIGADFTSTGLNGDWAPLQRLFSRYPNADKVISVYRREHLREWDHRGLHSATCYHLVAEDSFRSPEPDSHAFDLPLGARADWVRDDDYLVFALRDGIIARLVCVLPHSTRLGQWKREVLPRFRDYSCRVRAIPATDLEREMPAPQIICFSLLAPALSRRQLLENIRQSGAGDGDEVAERALEGYRDALCGRAPASFVFPYNVSRVITGSGAWLYHGSPAPALKALVPTAESPVFVSPVASFAACYGADLRSHKGWIQGTDFLSEDSPFTYLLVPPGREAELERPCSLYRVPESDAACQPAGSVPGFEFACGHEIQVAGEVTYPSVAEALAAHGVRVFMRGAAAMRDGAILAQLASEPAEAEAFFEMSSADICSLPFLEPLLYAFFVGRQGHAPSRYSARYRSVWMRLLRRLVFPTLSPYSLQPVTGYHGLSHSFRVATDAIALALEQEANPLLAMIAGVLHDAARTGDDEGDEHAAAGSLLARAVLPKVLPSWVTADGVRRVADVVAQHIQDGPPPDLLGGCLNDSDRLRLAWERGFEEHFFSTPAGARMACRGSDFAGNWLASRLHAGPTELKFEVTSACDLDCGFCHRHGVADPAGAMKFETFTTALEAAAEAGIRSIRLTGGEPFLHRGLRRMAEAARNRGMEVVVNTNATAAAPARMLAVADVVDCFKISLPAFDEPSMCSATSSRTAWRLKLEAVGELLAHGCRVEALTVMTPDNIRHFEDYLDLLGPLTRLRWVPLRPESTPSDPRPISAPQLRALVDAIEAARSSGTRWAELNLHLAVPFCAVGDPERAARVLKGRLGCGPADSLTVSAGGNLISCYSRRAPLVAGPDLSATWRRVLEDEFETLPEVCQGCAFGWRCLAGCRCEWALDDSPYGRLDYLANPANAGAWSS